MDRRPAARLIAFYLPQFHPIPENDEWWGKGFTEWTLVRQAKPLFRGHVQPRLPGELGFYDLRDPEIRVAQADLARDHGVEGFCYWHYWLGNGRRLLERPFQEVLESGQPALPFCLGWANHSWVGRFFGAAGRMLVEQLYPGKEDYRAHFDAILPALVDPRYITVDGAPLVYVYQPTELPNAREFTDLWRKLASDAGLPGLHFVGRRLSGPVAVDMGFDAFTYCTSLGTDHLQKKLAASWTAKISRKLLGRPGLYDYGEFVTRVKPKPPLPINGYPDLLTNWDNTPRLGGRGEVFLHASPDQFRVHVRDVLAGVVPKPREHRIVFIKSWNEWAEGNYLEPDARQGRALLEVVRDEVVAGS